MYLAFTIARRFLFTGKTQTLLILMGIAIGVSVQVFLGALIFGLQRNIVDKTIGSASHITIKSNSDAKLISKAHRALYEANSSDARILWMTQAADLSGFVFFKNEQQPLLLRGFDLESANKIYKLEGALYTGNLPRKSNEAIMGRELAEYLKTALGDEVTFSTSGGNKEKLTISGLFDLQVGTLNKGWLITNLTTVQAIAGYDKKVTSIEIQVRDVFAADVIGKKIKTNLSEAKLYVEDWKSLNAQLLSGLNGQSMSSYMIQVFVLLAVTTGIASVLGVSVLQRSRQIGILKAMGIKNGNASMIFVFQGLILGVFGAVFGISLGFLLLKMFSIFALNPDGTPIVAVFIDYGFIGISSLIAILVSVAAGFVPARLSSKLNPIDVIRNG